jgi:hypothetical protein
MVFVGYNEKLRHFLGAYFAKLVEAYQDPSLSINAETFFAMNRPIDLNLESFKNFDRENLHKAIDAFEAESQLLDPKFKGLAYFADMHLCNMLNILDRHYYKENPSGKEYKSVSLKSLIYVGNNDSNPVKDESYHYHLSRV